MNKLGPTRIPYPQRGATNPTEMSPRRAFSCFFGIVIPDRSSIGGNVFFALNFKCREIATEVNCVTAATRRLSTNGAVAQIERVRVGGPEFEPNTAAMTRSDEFHFDSVFESYW